VSKTKYAHTLIANRHVKLAKSTVDLWVLIKFLGLLLVLTLTIEAGILSAF